MRKILFIIIFLISLTTILYSLDPPERIYSIQLGAYPTLEEAEIKKTEYKSLGYSPVSIIQSPKWYKVRFGEFPIFLEGYLYCMDLRKEKCPDVWLVWQDNVEKKIDFITTVGPVEKYFNIPEKSSDELQTFPPYNDEPDYKLISELVEKKEFSASILIEEIEPIVKSLKDTDPVKGFGTMRLAYLNLKNTNRAKAKDLFREVAEGKISADSKERIEAMFRVARIEHSLNNRLTAYRAFDEINKFVVDNENKAEALVQLAGLTMELARCNYGQITETRRFCQQVLEVAPETSRRQKALAELMNAETYLYTKEYERGLGLAKEFEKNYSDQMREYGAGICLKATFYWRMKRWDEAKEALYQAKELPDNIEMFKDLNPKAFGSIYYASLTGAPEKEIEAILDKYRDTSDAKRIIKARELGIRCTEVKFREER